MPSSIEVNVRQPLATALASVTANVYANVPENPVVPFATFVPSSPYMELTLLNKSVIKAQLNYTITVGVAYNNNTGSLDNIEKLILQILAVIPAGWVIGAVERPTVTQVGVSNLLVADINVSTYYEQTN